MATIVNDADVALQATSPRLVPVTLPTNLIIPAVKAISLTAPSLIFQVNNAGAASPTSILLTAALKQITGSISFSVLSGSATLTSVTGTTATLTYANLASSTATIRASVTESGVTYNADLTIAKVVDGSNGTNGSRGSLTGYGTPYSLYLSGTPALDTANPWASGGTDEQRANRIIDNLVNGASSSANLASTAGNRVGDTVTMTDSGSTTAQTRYWSGTAWIKPGVVIDGSLLVTGTVIADALNVNGTTGLSLFSGGAVGKIVLDGSGNIVITSSVANKSIGFSAANGGVIRMSDSNSGTTTLSELDFLVPGSTDIAAFLQHSRPSPYSAGTGSMSLVSGYKDNLTIWAGQNTGSPLDVSGYGTLTLNAAAFSFPTAQLVKATSAATLDAVTTGAATATFNSTNKPGANSSNSWIKLTFAGTVYWLPVWTN